MCIRDRAYIESEVESLKEFQIRKIRWAIEELERQGKEITLWNLAETAGVKPRYMEKVQEKMCIRDRVYAVNVAKKSGDPFLLDLFHDVLAKDGNYKRILKK